MCEKKNKKDRLESVFAYNAEGLFLLGLRLSLARDSDCFMVVILNLSIIKYNKIVKILKNYNKICKN
jgi:hypothetical protein